MTDAERARTQPGTRITPSSPPRRVAVIGAGTIGLSWARLFASAGTAVVVADPRPDLAEVVGAMVDDAGLPAGAIILADSAGEAAADADFVQESGPERPGAKQELFGELVEAARADTVFASSSSAILPSRIAQRLPDDAAARVLVGHPFNPPHLMPLVEVVPGERTSAEAVGRAVGLYRSYGREPVVLKREIAGYVGNRLQNVVLREAAYLVQSGAVEARDLDSLVKNSLGLRWASVGPLEGFHLGGGAAGLRGFMRHIGPSFAEIDLHEPDLSDEGMASVYEQVEAAYGLPPRPEVARRRDEVQRAILRLRGQA